ncbi:MAG: HU family DNA-binding protein [Prevotella sp.]|nr:HU family DNA-binding protein [Prevotella sp.]
MERISIQEIANILIAKNGLKKKDADSFVAAMFDVVKDGLQSDRLVKVKGLGTFKVIDIEPRESVNINSGERVVIEGHGKITFTPDVTMKELVNKPFAQFETVTLNDGVVFDDETVSTDSDTEEDETDVNEFVSAIPPIEETSGKEVSVEETPVEEALVEEAPVEETPVEETPVAEVPVAEVPVEEAPVEEAPVEETSDDENGKKAKWLWLFGACLACAMSFAIGFYAGRQSLPTMNVEETSGILPMEADTIASKMVPEAPVNTVELPISTEPAKVESLPKPKVEPQPEPKVESLPKPKAESQAESKPESKPQTQTQKSEKSTATSAMDDYLKYEKMDGRVRTGAYRIVGTATEVKVKAGETVKRISNRHLGPDMECYVEVYNGVKANTVLQEGQILKIPKLELKKKKKKQQN